MQATNLTQDADDDDADTLVFQGRASGNRQRAALPPPRGPQRHPVIHIGGGLWSDNGRYWSEAVFPSMLPDVVFLETRRVETVQHHVWWSPKLGAFVAQPTRVRVWQRVHGPKSQNSHARADR